MAWRFAALGGATAGLLVSPFLAPAIDRAWALVAVAAVAVVTLAAFRPRAPVGAAAGTSWLACLALATAIAGAAAGSARLAAIDRGALDLAAGREAVVRGFVAAVPTRSGGEVSVRIETPDGRILVRAPEPVADLAVGSAVRVSGTIRDPGDWERTRLERLGIRDLLAADRIEAVAGRRGGLTGQLDQVRSRAEAALGAGTTAEAASLLRGFVLGQDDRIDAATVEEFKASGLAHLLAVSGQNVILLAVLATVALALLGVPLRSRLAWILALIAIYVPVAGAGASIQRAGVMGAAGIVAALAGRPRSRWYALLLAACATLGLDPRASADIGWQLSFAAVGGILLGSRPMAELIAGGARGWRRALADAVALTVAATIATAPLMAHHFGTVSLVSLPANLVALPAVAPVMWLGMLVAAAAQLSWLPVEPLTWLAGLLAAYIAQVAAWFGAPAWAQAELALGHPFGLALGYALAGTGLALVLRWAARRRSLRPAGAAGSTASRRRAVLAITVLVAVAAVAAAAVPSREAAGRVPGLRLTLLDVGQGDAILLEPDGRDPVLVDTGPAGAKVAERLEQRGIDRLAALVITHPENDHDGGAADVLARIPTGRLVFARASPVTVAAARGAGTRPVRVAAGARLRYGALRLSVLWPPPQRLAAQRGSPLDDPNSLSLVTVARWHGFEALLAGDAEAEAAPLAPGPVDVLKVAHHGSEDAGLERLLTDAQPRLALISVGENPYGHPSPATLAALDALAVPVLRTDQEGEIAIDVADYGWSVR
ncbi:MAG: fold metallo-hydrolase [Solirubrobacterales bacterium]|nr:fold metallo-hydrolase [Solirubrobacterales bacterium]